MPLSLLKLLRGYLQVTVVGGAPERFLNLCAKHNILIWNLQPHADPKTGGFDFCISRRGLTAAEELLVRTRTTLTIRKKCGLPYFLHRHRARRLFALGMVCSIFLLWHCSGYVWRIEVNGTQELSQEMIFTWLEQQEQGFGVKKAAVDCAGLEAALRRDFTVIAWTSVRLSGTQLTIDIKERLPEQSNAQRPTQGAYDLVASEDAVVASIYTRQGTPQTEAGNVVSAGAVLISGRLELLDDSGSITAYRYVRADGDVTGTVTRTYEATLPRAYQKKVYTAESETTYELKLGRLRLPLHKKAASYSACETYVTDHQLELLTHIFLPVHLYETTRRPYVYEPAVYTKNEVEAHARAGWELFLEKITQKGIPIIVKNVKIETNEKNCVIQGSIEAQIPLGKYAPTEQLTLPKQGGTTDAD